MYFESSIIWCRTIGKVLSRCLCQSVKPLMGFKAMKSLERDFVSGYVSVAEGEKDPRNLLLSFSIVRVLLIEFSINAQIEVRCRFLFIYFHDTQAIFRIFLTSPFATSP